MEPSDGRDAPVLEYDSCKKDRTNRAAGTWMVQLGGLYGVIVLISIVVVISMKVTDSTVSWGDASIDSAILAIILACAVVFYRCGRELRKGSRRGFWVAIGAILLNVGWLALDSAVTFWRTFGGDGDPGVPLLGLIGGVCTLGFAGLVLGPALFLLLRVWWMGRSGA